MKHARAYRPATGRTVALGGTCVVAVLLLGATRSRGQPAEGAVLDLDWQAPAGCPPKEAVLARIAELRQGPAGASAMVRANVSRRDAGDWRVVVSTHVGGSSGERTLQARSCEELVDATALVVVLAIDQARAAEQAAHTRTDAAPATPPSPAATPSASPTAPPTHAEAAPTSFVFVGERTTFGAGTLPGAVGGASVLMGWESGPWRLEVAGLAWAPRRASLDGSPSVGGRFTSYGGAARGCMRLARFVAEPFACAGAELASVEAQGYGVDHPASTGRWWASPAAGLALAWPLGRSWRLVIDATAAAPLSRPPFVIDADRTLFRPAPVAIRGGLGLDLCLF